MTEVTKSTDTIKMVDKALAILDELRISNAKLGVNELAKRCAISPSTTFRILKTLVVNGWVFQCSDNKYIAGKKLSFVTEKNNMYLALKDVAYFTMNKYTAKYNLPMNLIVRDGANCFIIQQSRTNQFVDYVVPINTIIPFYACAGGKILLSELPILMVDMLLETTKFEAFTPHTITTADQFWRELRTVAGQGYAFDIKESSPNGSCVAVPVRDEQGTIIAALSFSGFVGLEDGSELLHYIPILKEASLEISHKMFNYQQFPTFDTENPGVLPNRY